MSKRGKRRAEAKLRERRAREARKKLPESSFRRFSVPAEKVEILRIEKSGKKILVARGNAAIDAILKHERAMANDKNNSELKKQEAVENRKKHTVTSAAIVAIAFAIVGAFCVWLGGSNAISQLEIPGLKLVTGSVGVASLAIAAWFARKVFIQGVK